jgi:hypothetical protein
MSGDQSEYIRGKEAMRSKTTDARFMKDGFDEWAESTRPAREGQIEKNPAEEQMTTTGGAMSLRKAKHVAKYLAKSMRRGGSIVDDIMALVPDNIKRQVDAVLQATKGVIGAYRNVSSFIDEFIQEIKDEFIENPKANAKAKAFAIRLVDAFNKLKIYKDSLDGVAKILEGVGLGRGGQRRGGDLAATVKTVVDKAKQIFGTIMTWLKWFYDNAVGISQFLKLKSLNRADLPVTGKQLLDYIQPIFDVTDKLSGLLASAKKGGRGCQCEHSSDEEEGQIVKRRGGYGKSESVLYADEPQSVRMEGEPSLGIESEELIRLKKKCKQLEEGRYGGRRDERKRFGGYGKSESVLYADEPQSVRMEGEPVQGIESEELIRLKKKCKQLEEGRYGGRTVYSSGISSSQGVGGRKKSARGEIVKRVMREQGLSLPQASKYVKEHGLY